MLSDLQTDSLFSLFDVKIRYNFYHHKITFSSFKHGDKLNKCNQCDFASVHASALRTHLKIHSGEKPNKCKQCDYAFSRAILW